MKKLIVTELRWPKVRPFNTQKQQHNENELITKVVQIIKRKFVWFGWKNASKKQMIQLNSDERFFFIRKKTTKKIILKNDNLDLKWKRESVLVEVLDINWPIREVGKKYLKMVS